MPNTSISNLTAGGAVAGTDLFPDVQTVGVGPVKVTATQLKTFMNASPSITGSITLNGATSGTVTLGVPAVAGTTTFTLPGTNGTNGFILTTNGSGVTSWTNPTALGIDLDVGTTAITNGTATRVLFEGAGNVLQESANLTWNDTTKLLTVTGLGTGGGANTGGLTVSGGPFGLSGNISANAWTTSGIRYRNVAATLTDLTSTGTVATAYTDLFGGNTIAASSATTFTNYYTSWFSAPTAGTNVTFTGRWAMGLGGPLDIQAGTVTTNTTPALNLTQTWNAGAVTFTGILFNAAGASGTNSASGSLLLDLQTGGVSQLYITKAGSFYVNQKASFAGNTTIGENGSGHIVTRSAGILGFTSTTSGASVPDTIISRAAAASIRLGDADAAAPVAQTFKVQSVVGSTPGASDVAGANFTIQGSAGRGSGAGGSIIFQVAPAGTGGSGAQNAYSTALTLDSTKLATFGGKVASSFGYTYGQPQFYDASFGVGSGLQVVSGVTTALYGNNAALLAVSSNASGVTIAPSLPLSWSSVAHALNTPDVYLYRDAANTLALRNGTNAQTLRVYNTYTDAGNNEYGAFTWSSNIFEIGTVANGTGIVRNMNVKSNYGLYLYSASGASMFFYTNGTGRWYLDGANGHILAFADNTYDIGASGANRPRNVYVAGTVAAGNASIGIVKCDYINNSSNSRSFWLFSTSADSAQYGPGLTAPIMQFAGTTSSFPALKRSSASLICRLADDSANAAFEALSLKTGAPTGGTSGTWKLGVRVAATTTLDTTQYIEVDVGGTLYKLAVVTS